eukprot:gnl/TRDRNA2_/TRDRNA2_194890_c0_seq1.p1 gnl/TRDRNA2_/TRDRNA2_194890_c0~~gnl/TRDRNA2_/TRDRNA2_194890_c0_seq1.p1  ORF type:complete len:246 (-),score=55.35 gnl/TRDRNA2_/TRDRNA2_194890_c0_seq1:80-817(-)
MGADNAKLAKPQGNAAFTPKELYNLKQVYFFLCLHTTTLTSCPLDRTQFHALFGAQKQYKALWRALFSAIDTNGDNVIDFEEFLTFVTALKRGNTEAQCRLCFRLFDPNRDGIAEKADFQSIAQTQASTLRKASWKTKENKEDGEEDEYVQFFNACDADRDGKINLEDFEKISSSQGEPVAIVKTTLKLLEGMFDTAIEETGIVITSSDVKNSKPHIDWQDHKIGMNSFFCCSTQPPLFTTAPTA